MHSHTATQQRRTGRMEGSDFGGRHCNDVNLDLRMLEAPRTERRKNRSLLESLQNSGSQPVGSNGPFTGVA